MTIFDRLLILFPLRLVEHDYTSQFWWVNTSALYKAVVDASLGALYFGQYNVRCAQCAIIDEWKVRLKPFTRVRPPV